MGKHRVPVHAWSQDLRLIRRWEDPAAAANDLGTTPRIVRKMAQANTIHGGWLITFEPDPMAVAMIMDGARFAPGTVEVYELQPVLLFRAVSKSEAARMMGYKPKRVCDAVTLGGVVDKKYVFKEIK